MYKPKLYESSFKHITDDDLDHLHLRKYAALALNGHSIDRDNFMGKLEKLQHDKMLAADIKFRSREEEMLERIYNDYMGHLWKMTEDK